MMRAPLTRPQREAFTRTVRRHAVTPLPEQIAVARAFVRGLLDVWGLPAQRDDMELVTSEMVTNAMVHGQADESVLFDVVFQPVISETGTLEGRATARARFSIDRFVHEWDVLLRNLCGPVGLVRPGGGPGEAPWRRAAVLGGDRRSPDV